MGEKLALSPLGRRLLVKQLSAEEVSEGGIIIPELAQHKPEQAEILAMGDDCEYSEISVGDVIILPPMSE